MKRVLLLILFFVAFVSKGQVYLHDTTSYNGTYASFLTSAFEVDSGYYVMGSTLSPGFGVISELMLGFIHNDGSHQLILKDYDTLNDQMVYGGVNKLIMNERGNFVYCYRNCDTANCYPRIKEISTEGMVIFDKKFDFLLDSLNDSVGGDFNDFIQVKQDSSYVISCGIYGNLPDRGSFNLYIHLDSDFNILDTIIMIPSVNWGHTAGKLVEGNNGNVICIVSEVKGTSPNSINAESNARLLKIDNTNTILLDETYTDGQRLTLPLGLCKSAQSGYFFTYIRQHWDGSNWDAVHHVGKVDENFNPIWSKPIRKDTFETFNQFTLQHEIKPTLDGNYVVVGGFPDTSLSISTAQITKFTEDGDFLWQRYLHLPDDGTVPGVEIKDVIATADSGYCMVGQMTFFGPTFQRGYIVKTNCLGFLGEPEAAANHQIMDDFTVQFVNTSTQAGSYTWYFGPSASSGTVDTLYTDEYTDTVFYTFPSSETYEVLLIAHGCNGSADTLSFQVQPDLHIEPLVTSNGNGYFSIFPNPVLLGNELYVYLNELTPENGEVYLTFVNLQGQKVDEISLTTKEGTYALRPNLANGMYMVNLYQGNALLRSNKLMVE